MEGVRGILPIHHGAGLSGKPLHQRSLAVISQLRRELGANVPIIGVGGITTADAALETLKAGANLYRLVYKGTGLLDEILRSLAIAGRVAEDASKKDDLRRK